MGKQGEDEDGAADQRLGGGGFGENDPDPDGGEHGLDQVEHADFRRREVARAGGEAPEGEGQQHQAVEEDVDRFGDRQAAGGKEEQRDHAREYGGDERHEAHVGAASAAERQGDGQQEGRTGGH